MRRAMFCGDAATLPASPARTMIEATPSATARLGLLAGSLAAAAALAACSAEGPLGSEAGEPDEASASVGQLTEVDSATARAAGGVARVHRDELVAAAAAYARRELPELGPEARLIVLGHGETAEGIAYVRLAQLHGEVPVLGAEVVVVGKRDAAGSIELSAVHGSLLYGLERLSREALRPEIDADRALALAKQRYQQKVTEPSAALAFSRERAELVLLPRQGEAARLCWRAQLFTESQAGVEPGLWITFVDALTGEVVEERNDLATLSQASGPGGNPNVTRSWVAALDVEPHGGSGTIFKMDTARQTTYDMRTTPPVIVIGPLDPIGDAAINDAHGFIEIALDMLLSWQGQNSINGAGMKIIARVHAPTSNASWDGTGMTFGVGGPTAYPLQGSIDIVGHELAHGFTAFHANLTRAGQSGGVNESFSDIAGETTEAFYKGLAPDFLVGVDVLVGGGFLRNLCAPTADGVSIDHISSYTASTPIHASSGIMNKAFCRTARRMGSGTPTGAATLTSVRRASKLWFTANQALWTSSTSFQQACAGTFSAASLLGYNDFEKWALRQSWIDVGITCGAATSPVTFTINDPTNVEGNGVIGFTVTKANNDGLSHTLTYTTANNTANSKADYFTATGTITFAPAETTKSIIVSLRSDTVPEGFETFFVNLSGLTNGGSILDAQGEGAIIDDD